jgi:hypothetical protein
MVGRRKIHAPNLLQTKKRARINGFLGIDVLGADYFFQASESAKSEHIAAYFADLVKYFEDKKKKRIDIFMDNNPTHKQKMQQIFAVLTKDLKIEVKFYFIAAYSPKLNVVEYVIHWIRQEVLHHADAQKSLQDFQKIIEDLCKKGEILNKEQLTNILCHIENLVNKNTNVSAKRE